VEIEAGMIYKYILLLYNKTNIHYSLIKQYFPVKAGLLKQFVVN